MEHNEIIEKLLAYGPRDLKTALSNFHEDVHLVDYGDDIKELATEVLRNFEIDAEIIEAGIYQFKSVGMHTDYISGDDVGSLLIVLHGSGHLNYFRNKADYKNLKISGEMLSKGSVRFFDDKLPHSFILTSEDPCVCCIVEILKKKVPKHLK
jgi:hypothetical protein